MIVLLGCAVSAARSTDAAAADSINSVAVAGHCPQPRTTERAPDSDYERVNPLPMSAEHLQRGRQLYETGGRPANCNHCHGVLGDGKGPAGADLDPPPRNFTCAATMEAITDGQLYWVIENGSGAFHLPSRQGAQQIKRPGRGKPTTGMRGYGDRLAETEIWQLILYLRSLSAKPTTAVDPEPRAALAHR